MPEGLPAGRSAQRELHWSRLLVELVAGPSHLQAAAASPQPAHPRTLLLAVGWEFFLVLFLI